MQKCEKLMETEEEEEEVMITIVSAKKWQLKEK